VSDAVAQAFGRAFSLEPERASAAALDAALAASSSKP
jgi:hypothetical protein